MRSILPMTIALAGLACTLAAKAEAGKEAVPAKAEPQPAFQLPALPYAPDALAPHISAETISYHYGKHHKAYVDNLNKEIVGTKWEKETSLEKIVAESAGDDKTKAVFNNAAQAWNHDFFWKSMKPAGGGEPTGKLLEKINASFGSYDNFKKEFSAAAMSQFGSGWAWLVKDGDALKIVKTANADTPIAQGVRPLMTCDVWEHAYYIDYRNNRKNFVTVFLDSLVNWDFAASQL